MLTKTRTISVIVAGAASLMLTAPAMADFPTRGLNLIVAYGAGGGTDITARARP